MSIFRNVARWAERLADESEKAKAAKRAKMETRKQRKFKQSAAETPLTVALFANTLQALEGHFSSLNDQQLEKIAELIVKQAALTDEHIDGHVASLSAELVDVLKVISNSNTENLARVHEDIVGGQRVLHNIQVKKLDEIATAVANTLHRVSVHQSTTNSQFLEMLQHMREGRIEQFALTEVICERVHNMEQAFNARLDAIEANTQKRKRQYEPSLEWMVDNYDEIARFVKGVETMRNNDAPGQMAMLATVHSLKSFGDYPTAVIKEQIETKLLNAA